MRNIKVITFFTLAALLSGPSITKSFAAEPKILEQYDWGDCVRKFKYCAKATNEVASPREVKNGVGECAQLKRSCGKYLPSFCEAVQVNDDWTCGTNVEVYAKMKAQILEDLKNNKDPKMAADFKKVLDINTAAPTSDEINATKQADYEAKKQYYLDMANKKKLEEQAAATGSDSTNKNSNVRDLGIF